MRDFVDEELELATRSLRELPHQPAVVIDGVLSTLIAAREWLSDPAHWHRKDFCDVGEDLQAAGATCAWGAVMRGSGQPTVHTVHAPASDAICYLSSVLRGTQNPLDVSDFNDDPDTTHAAMLALFDRAIASRTAEVGK